MISSHHNMERARTSVSLDDQLNGQGPDRVHLCSLQQAQRHGRGEHSKDLLNSKMRERDAVTNKSRRGIRVLKTRQPVGLLIPAACVQIKCSLNPGKKFKTQRRSLSHWKDLRSADAWKMARVIISQILKTRMTSPWVTQEKQKGFAPRKFQCSPFLTVFQIFSYFKANFIVHVRIANTSPLALPAHAVNYASQIKRGLLNSAFIYPIVYHKALLCKGNSCLLTDDRPR